MTERRYDNLRSSIDTLYLGFRSDLDFGSVALDDINNYLSSMCFISQSEGKGNQYYWYSYFNKESGVSIFVEPREGLKNDFMTIQLSGKFFHDIWGSRNFLIWLFEKYQDYLIFQRIDVAVDVLFKEFPRGGSHDGYLAGFPVPSYSEEYKYCKQGFEIYGRCSSNPNIMAFNNMVAQGRGDCRLRVYDKTLDNYEKDHKNYSDVYMFETDYEQVYRIEFQCRGQYLKGFYDKYIGRYGKLTYSTLVEELLNYVFHKYEFEGIIKDDVVKCFKKPLSFSKLKKKQCLENAFEHNKAIVNKAYFRCCEISDKLQAQRQVAEAFGISKELIHSVIGDFDMYACAKEFEDLIHGELNK